MQFERQISFNESRKGRGKTLETLKTERGRQLKQEKKMLRFALKLEEGIPSLTYFAPTTGRITI